MPKGFNATTSNSMIVTKPRGFNATTSNSMIMTKPRGFSTKKKDGNPSWRKDLFKGKLAQSIEDKISSIKLPTKTTLAGTSLFRFIDPKFNLNYFQVFSQLPPGPGRGADSPDNRWTGRSWKGVKGRSGAYWGSTDGISAETFFYNCIKGYDPNAGPLRILPPMIPLLITGLQNRLPYCPEGVDVSPELPFSGNYKMNIVIAKTIRNIVTTNMDVMSPQFQEWADRLTKMARGELDELEFKDIAEAIEHGEFKDISRLIGNLAGGKGCDALVSKSVRRSNLNAPIYDPNNANNMVFFGNDGEPLTGLLVGKGVIEVRPSTGANTRGSGAEATIVPMSVYPSPPNSKLSIRNAPDSTISISQPTESSPLPTGNTGPSGQMLSNSTERVDDEASTK
jgi:hypothetical protein